MLQKPKPHGFELVCHVPTSCNDIVIRDSLAYLANGWNGFSILDLSNASSPSLLGTLHSPNYAWGLNVYDHIACIAEHPGDQRHLVEESGTLISYLSGVQFIDIRQPSNPFEFNRFLAEDFVDDVVAHNEHIFILANHEPEPFTCTLLIISMQDTKKPELIGKCSISGRGYQLVISERYVYVATFDGLHIIDISSFDNPREIHYIGNHLSLEGHGIQCDGQNLYIASYFQGLRIFKLQTGMPPLPLSRTLLWGTADDVAIQNNVAYVSDIFYGLWRFDITNPESPVETGFYPLEHGDRKVVVANSQIFVAAKHAGLFILRDTQGQRDINISRRPGYTTVFDD